MSQTEGQRQRDIQREGRKRRKRRKSSQREEEKKKKKGQRKKEKETEAREGRGFGTETETNRGRDTCRLFPEGMDSLQAEGCKTFWLFRVEIFSGPSLVPTRHLVGITKIAHGGREERIS